MVSDGTYNVTFRIYNQESGGSALWEETHSLGVTNGIVSVNLGSVTSFPDSLTFNSDPFYLGVKVGGDDEMSPRKRIGAVPAAFNADTIDGHHAGTGANEVLVLDESGNADLAAGKELQIGGTTVCTSSGCAGAGGAASFVQGGNSFGALATLGTNDNNDLAVETNGTERMRIDTSGNVGIGTTAASNVKFHISQGVNDGARLRVQNTTTDTNAFAQLSALATSSAGNLYAFNSSYTTSGQYIAASALLEASGAGGLGLSALSGSGTIRLYTNNGVERMRIDSSGNVGIGTSPSATLHVHNASTSNPGVIRVGSANNGVGGHGSRIEILAEASPVSANKKNFQIVNFSSPSGADYNALIFRQANDALSSSSGLLTLTHGGASPGSVLMGSYANSPSTAGPSEGLAVSGSVGIGRVDPQTKLHVVGSTGEFTRFQGATGAAGWINLYENTTLRSYIGYESPGGGLLTNGTAGSTVIRAANNLHLVATSNALNGLTVTTSGTFGIGTTSPGGLFHGIGGNFQLRVANVATDTTTKISRIVQDHYTNAEEPVGLIVGTADSTTSIVEIGGGSSLVNAATELRFNTSANNTTTSGTQRLRIESDGDIVASGAITANASLGIGTAPSFPLHVSANNASVAVNILQNNASGFGVKIKPGSDSNYAMLINNTADDTNRHAFYGSGNVNLAMTSGHVGIGVNGGSTQLHVQGNGANEARFSLDQTASGGNRWDVISATNGLHGVTNGSLLFWNNNQSQTRLAIEAGGNVGIGVNTPGEKFTVAGDNVQFMQAASGNSAGFLFDNYYAVGSGSGTKLQFKATDNSNKGYLALEDDSAGGTNSTLRVFVPNSSSTQTERMRIDAAGQATFYGANNGATAIRVDANDAGTIFTSHNTSAGGTPQQFQILHNLGFTEIKNLRGGIGILPSTGNNIGLGTNQPNWPVHVLAGGTAQLMTIQNTSTNTGVGVLLRDGAGTTRTNFLIGANYNISNAFEVTPSTATDGTTFSTPAFIVTSSGNSGFGTSSGINSRITLADHTAAAGGILFGTDTNLYRSAANTLKTDDSLNIVANLTLDGQFITTPSTTQTLAAGDPILANATKVKVAGSGGAVVLTSTPTIADGTNGQLLYIQGTDDTNTITVQDQTITLPSSNLELGGVTRILGKGDVLVLSFDGTDSVWYEVSFTNN